MCDVKEIIEVSVHTHVEEWNVENCQIDYYSNKFRKEYH